MPSKSQKSAARDRESIERAIIAVLKASREDADLGRQELADNLGLTMDQIVNLEHGRRAWQLSDFILFARDIGMEPTALLERILRW